MKQRKELRGFRGAEELAEHAVRASGYLKQVYAACEGGDKAEARRALRQAIIELETARAGLRVGMD
jgi:hypothetical protein